MAGAMDQGRSWSRASWARFPVEVPCASASGLRRGSRLGRVRARAYVSRGQSQTSYGPNGLASPSTIYVGVLHSGSHPR